MRTSNVMTYTHRLASGLTRVIPRLALMAVPLLLIAVIFSACDDDTMAAMPTETPQSVSVSTPPRPSEETARLGDEIYERDIRQQVEADYPVAAVTGTGAWPTS